MPRAFCPPALSATNSYIQGRYELEPLQYVYTEMRDECAWIRRNSLNILIPVLAANIGKV
jgi:hypothetical protein